MTAHRSGGGAGALRVRAGVVVGADGSRSRVRDLLGIAAVGRDYPDTYLMGDLVDHVDQAAEREAVVHLEPDRVVESFPLPGAGRRWVAHTGTRGTEPTPDLLAALVRERTGVSLDPGSCTMLSAFTVRRRTARRLLSRRCVLLGDAAHEVSPIGGQGITLGWLDALDLAPLLARHAAGDRTGALREDPDWRRTERRIRCRAGRAGMIAAANTALGRPAGPRIAALRTLTVRALLRTPLRHTLTWVYSMGWARPGRPTR